MSPVTSLLQEISLERTRIFLSIYFAPVFTFFMLGYYFNNEVIRSIVSLSSDFNWFSAFFIVLISLSVIGRFLSEIAGYILLGSRYVFYWGGLFLYKTVGLLHKIKSVRTLQKKLHILLTKEDVHVDPIKRDMLFDEHPHMKSWYYYVYTYSMALQSAFGAFLVLFLFYQGTADFPVGTLLILFFFLAYIAKRHFLETERSLHAMLKR